MRAFSIFPPRSSDDAIFTRTFRKLWRWFVRGKGRKLWEQGLSCVTAVRRRPVPRRKARRARPLCVNSRITRCLCFFYSLSSESFHRRRDQRANTIFFSSTNHRPPTPPNRSPTTFFVARVHRLRVASRFQKHFGTKEKQRPWIKRGVYTATGKETESERERERKSFK